MGYQKVLIGSSEDDQEIFNKFRDSIPDEFREIYHKYLKVFQNQWGNDEELITKQIFWKFNLTGRELPLAQFKVGVITVFKWDYFKRRFREKSGLNETELKDLHKKISRNY